MNKIILIKYAELTTKKGNRGFFVKTLKRNIETKLKHVNHTIKSDYARMFIESGSFEETLNILEKIPGIHEIVIAYKLNNNDLENIKEASINILKDKEFTTFKVESRRSLKTYPLNSMELSKTIGGHILKNIGDIKVNIKNPEVLFNIEVRTDAVYLYFESIKGLGGYPVGVQGKSLLMLSGGIDSPVAGFLSCRRGMSLDYVYFDSPPHTSEEAKNKVKELAKIITGYSNDSKLYIINFTKIQEEILKNCPHDYLITIMRRMMYRICEKITEKYKLLTIVNGENVGQVASQTLTSMRVINEVVKTPVIRPLATYDKIDIINIAKKIGTYETSILPYEDCCTIFVPKHPVINPKSEKSVVYENSLDYNKLIEETINNIEIIKITNKTEPNEYL